MAISLMALTLCAAAAAATGIPAAKYPAGVDPHACPNYPYCDNVALAVGHHGAVAPYAAPTYSTYGHYGAGAKYPAGVSPHTCPNYPYCDNVALANHGAAHGLSRYGLSYTVPFHGYGLNDIHHGAGARYPAGVDPHSCPNYPYCQH